MEATDTKLLVIAKGNPSLQFEPGLVQGAKLRERKHPAVPLRTISVRVGNSGQVPVFLNRGKLGEVCR